MSFYGIKVQKTKQRNDISTETCAIFFGFTFRLPIFFPGISIINYVWARDERDVELRWQKGGSGFGRDGRLNERN